VVGAGRQDGHQAEFGDAETARGDGQRRQQPDEREGGEGGLPGRLRLGQAGSAQAGQQDQPQGKVARRRGGGDPPAAGRDRGGGPRPEAGQPPGGVGWQRPAGEAAGGGSAMTAPLGAPGLGGMQWLVTAQLSSSAPKGKQPETAELITQADRRPRPGEPPLA
jgi:hypothetical protein